MSDPALLPSDGDTITSASLMQPQSPHLLAMLELLPLEVFDVHIWTLMSPEARGSLRLTCRHSTQLVDLLLLTSATLSLYLGETDPHPLRQLARCWWLSVEERQQLVTHTLAGRRVVLHESMERFAAFVARLPRLTALELQSWHGEADLVRALSLCSAATGRIARLTLGGQELSAPTLQAVREACPRLSALHLLNCGAPGDERNSQLTLVGEVLAPLHGTRLRHLEVGYEVVCCRDMMHSVGGLSHLVDLSLSVSSLDTADLCLLTGLRRLQCCYIGYLHPGATLVQAASLFHSTGLTSFELNVDHPSRPGREHPRAEVAAAVAQLGGLVNLEVLDLGGDFFAGEEETAALGRCRRLQELKLGRLGAGAPADGNLLPRLHTLRVGPDEGLTDMLLTPSTFLQALLPLLPLPSLTSLNGDSKVQIDISHHGADAAAVAALAAALSQALLHLAAAPQLQLGGPEEGALTFSSSDTPDGWDPALLSLSQLGDALLPWLGRLHCLHLTEMDLPSEGWEALQARLPGLSHLHLSMCKVRRPALVAIAQEWTALRRLTVINCNSPRERGWEKLARHRAHPLMLDVQPAVAPHVVARCQAVQEECYGTQHVGWVAPESAAAHGGTVVRRTEDDDSGQTTSSESNSAGPDSSGQEDGDFDG